MDAVADVIRRRHSERGAYDPARPVAEADLRAIVEAARWAPTAHNMQNFEIVVVDDPAVLAEIGETPTEASREFVRENFHQLSFSEEELVVRGTGLLADSFPPSWRQPDAALAEIVAGTLADTLGSCPTVLLVLRDTRRRAPASAGDALGLISLGCVLENMWLAAEDRGVALQVVSALSAPTVQRRLREVLAIPEHLDVAFGCRLGHPAVAEHRLRVRRSIDRFVHRNAYRARPGAPSPG